MPALNFCNANGEIIQLPLTNRYPINIAQMMFRTLNINLGNDETVYTPLVRTADRFASAVRISENYAVSTVADFSPITHDSIHEQDWTQYGSFAQTRGELVFNATNGLYHPETLALNSTSIFRVSIGMSPTTLGGTQTLFGAYNTANSSKNIVMYINSSKKMVLNLNGSAIRTYSTALANSVDYACGFYFNNGRFNLHVDGNYVGDVSKTITEGNYQFFIGMNYSKAQGFKGTVYNVTVAFDGNPIRQLYFGG